MIFSWADGKTDFEGSRFVRKKVFVEEQGFQEALEFDETDDRARHLTVLDGSRAVATARLFQAPGEEASGVFHVGRISVLKEYRGKHLGTTILEETEKEVLRLGGSRLVLGAQTRAAGFYEKCGYSICGEPYFDEFCPHVKMGKALHSSQQ